MNTKVLTITNAIEKRAYVGLAWAFLGCVVAYGVLVSVAVFDTAKRHNFENEARSLYSQVGKLEADYIARAKTIDLSLARSIGFQDAVRVKFTTRTTVVGVGNLARNEI